MPINTRIDGPSVLLNLVAHAQQTTIKGNTRYESSVDNEGRRDGFDIDLYKFARKKLSMPLIANGGAGSYEDFLLLAQENIVEGLAAGACYHFSSITPREVSEFLKKRGIHTRNYI